MATLTRTGLIVMSFALFAACGGNQRERTIKTTFVGLNAARDGFIAWDEAHQQNIVGSAATYEAGRESLSRYRDQREPVIRALAAAYRAVAAAALEPGETTVAEAVAAAIDVYQEIERLTGRPPRAGP